MRKLLFTPLLLFAFGCHAQVAPTTFAVALTVTPNASVCTSSQPCQYLYSRQTLTAGANSCGATTGANYAVLNSGALTGTTFTDSSASGLTVCYTAQSEQTSGTYQGAPCTTAAPCISVAATPPAGPFAVPGQIGAPSISGSTSTVSENSPPAMPQPTGVPYYGVSFTAPVLFTAPGAPSLKATVLEVR